MEMKIRLLHWICSFLGVSIRIDDKPYGTIRDMSEKEKERTLDDELEELKHLATYTRRRF